jgi:hypothetical protein
MELNNKRDLERFFSGLEQEDARSGSYLDLEFEVIEPGTASLILVSLWAALCAVVDRVIGRKRLGARRWGRRVRVFFPKPLRLDLWIESRLMLARDDDPLRASFYWPSISEDIVSRLFEGGIRYDLLYLGSLLHVLLTNEWLQCGPLPPAANEAAEILQRATHMVSDLNELANNLKPAPGELDEKT